MQVNVFIPCTVSFVAASAFVETAVTFLTWVVVLLVDSIYICDERCSLCVYTIQLRTQTLQKKQR